MMIAVPLPGCENVTDVSCAKGAPRICSVLLFRGGCGRCLPAMHDAVPAYSVGWVFPHWLLNLQ
jgi:hypothetical protein